MLNGQKQIINNHTHNQPICLLTVCLKIYIIIMKSTTEFTSTKRVMFVIKLIDGDKIEQFDHNININLKLIAGD